MTAKNTRSHLASTVVGEAKLKIADPAALVNAIAGTYKDVYRACMEYVDNALDAAHVAAEGGAAHVRVDVLVDSKRREIVIRDNAGGMTPKELKNLLESIGASSKKSVSWANGQFGFGVHAFRAFAKEAEFTSCTAGGRPHRLTIDRTLGADDPVPVHQLAEDALDSGVTEVRIRSFDRGVLKTKDAAGRLKEEIEAHFQDVLRETGIDVLVGDVGGRARECEPFDHTDLPGAAFARDVLVGPDGAKSSVSIDIKLLDKVVKGQTVRVTANDRRIAALADLASFRTHCRRARRDMSVWHDPCLVGVIEVGDAIQPNLTRDDLKQTDSVFELYEALIDEQTEIEALLAERRRKKMGRNRRNVGDMISSYLSKYLKGFKLEIELQPGMDVPAAGSGGDGQGGGGAGPDLIHGDGTRGDEGSGGAGNADTGGGPGPSRRPGEGARAKKSRPARGAPNIVFEDYEDGERAFERGHDIVVNTAHPDFRARNRSGDEIDISERVLSYIATVVSPLCVVSLAEKKGVYLPPLDVATEVASFTLGLEAFLQESAGKLKSG